MENDLKLPAFTQKIVDRQQTMNATTTTTTATENNASSFDENNNDVEFLQIVVKRTGSGEVPCLELSIEESATVMDLKLLIQDELADEHSPSLIVPVERQRLIYAGKMLTSNEMRLIEDVNMTRDKINYIHLAPIPKGRAPSMRNRLENKFSGQRMASRRSRSFRPYNAARGGGCQSSSNRMNQSNINNNEDPSSALLRTAAQQSLLDGLRSASALSYQQNSSVMDVMDTAVLQDTNAIIPLCQLLPSQLQRVVRGAEDHHQPEQHLLTMEETIVLLDQLSRRSATLSQSLRSIMRGTAHHAQAAALFGLGVPLGQF